MLARPSLEGSLADFRILTVLRMSLNHEELPIENKISPELTESTARLHSPRNCPMRSKAWKILNLSATLLLLGLEVYIVINQRPLPKLHDSSAHASCDTSAINVNLPEAGHSIQDNPAVKLVPSWQVDYWAELPCSGSTNWQGGYTGTTRSGYWSLRKFKGISLEEEGFKFCFYERNNCASRAQEFSGEHTCLNITRFRRFRVVTTNEYH